MAAEPNLSLRQRPREFIPEGLEDVSLSFGRIVESGVCALVPELANIAGEGAVELQLGIADGQDAFLAG